MQRLRDFNLWKYWDYDSWLLDETTVFWLSIYESLWMMTILHEIKNSGY
jgi:hypothetical protein